MRVPWPWLACRWNVDAITHRPEHRILRSLCHGVRQTADQHDHARAILLQLIEADRD
jgi:hypothetical protein